MDNLDSWVAKVYDSVVAPTLVEINKSVDGGTRVFIDKGLVDVDNAAVRLKDLLAKKASSVLGKFEKPKGVDFLPSPIREDVRGRVYVVLYQNENPERRDRENWRLTVARADYAGMPQFYNNYIFAFDIEKPAN